MSVFSGQEIIDDRLTFGAFDRFLAKSCIKNEKILNYNSIIHIIGYKSKDFAPEISMKFDYLKV